MGRAKKVMRGAIELPVRAIHFPRFLGGIDLSDHRNYWAAGYDAMMVADTAFFRNENYHGPGDLPETLDYERIKNVVLGVYEVVVHLANDGK